MTDRTIVITGPLEDEHIAAIVAIVRQAEETMPLDRFRVLIDDSEAEERAGDMQEHFTKLAGEVAPGYQRVIEVISKDP